jgi:Protein of unknown function (DUF3352)
MRGRTTKWLGGIAATALAVVLAGCGGGGGGGASNASLVTGSSSASSLAPASSLAYFAVDTNLGSDQWKQVDTLLSRFPDKAKLLTQLQQAWQKDTKTNFQTDVEPALGDQLDGVVFGEVSSHPDFVALLQPKDENAFKRLVTKLDASDPSNKAVVADYQGWKLVADTQGAIDRFETAAKAGPALADDASYKDAMSNLSGDAVATVYANGAKLSSALTKSFPQSGATTQNGKLDWAAADLTAVNDGMRLDGAAKTEGLKSTPTPAKAALLDKIPAGALAVLWFNGETLKDESGQLRKAFEQGFGASAGAKLPQLQLLLPAFEQLAATFAHENALYVRSGIGPIPEVTLVTNPDDPAKAASTVQQLLGGLGGTRFTPKPITIGSVHAQQIDLGPVSIYFGADEGRFVVTTQQQAFEDLRSGGSKLSGDATFKEAQSTSGMPDATDGFLYVNLKDSIPLLESLAQLGGTQITPEVANNLKPLRTAVAWATNDGPVGKFSVFVEVK